MSPDKKINSYETFRERLLLISLLEIYQCRPLFHLCETQKTILLSCFQTSKCLLTSLLVPSFFPCALLLWSISFIAIWPNNSFLVKEPTWKKKIKKRIPLILTCANVTSIALFSGYSIYADTKSALAEYKLFTKTVSFALNNALVLITLSQDSWTTLRSPLWNSKKTYLAQTGLLFTARLYLNSVSL